MSPGDTLTYPFFSEVACPPKRQKNRLPQGAGLRILQILRAEFPNPLTPKQIAPLARVTHANAKKWLNRNEGTWCRLTTRGSYRALADAKLLKRIGLEPYQVHGIQAVALSPNGGLPPAIKGLGDTKRTKDGQVMQRAEFRGRTVTVQDGGLISIRATTMPFDVPEFMECLSWLEGLTTGATVRITKLELNTDVPDWRLRMDGAALTLHGVREGLWKAYQKRELQVLRFEAAPRRVDMSLQEVARVLQEFSTAPADLFYPPGNGFEVS
jgi:hypothetical protein